MVTIIKEIILSSTDELAIDFTSNAFIFNKCCSSEDGILFMPTCCYIKYAIFSSYPEHGDQFTYMYPVHISAQITSLILPLKNSNQGSFVTHFLVFDQGYNKFLRIEGNVLHLLTEISSKQTSTRCPYAVANLLCILIPSCSFLSG